MSQTGWRIPDNNRAISPVPSTHKSFMSTKHHDPVYSSRHSMASSNNEQPDVDNAIMRDDDASGKDNDDGLIKRHVRSILRATSYCWGPFYDDYTCTLSQQFASYHFNLEHIVFCFPPENGLRMHLKSFFDGMYVLPLYHAFHALTGVSHVVCINACCWLYLQCIGYF